MLYKEGCIFKPSITELKGRYLNIKKKKNITPDPVLMYFFSPVPVDLFADSVSSHLVKIWDTVAAPDQQY